MKKVFKALLSIISISLFAASMPLTSFAEPNQDIVELASDNDDFSVLVRALQEADLVDTLKDEGPFTVFAPTNEAFDKLLVDLDITAEELLAQPDLEDILTYHVLAGKVMAGDLEDGMETETVNGETATFDLTGEPMINMANIITTDLDATNGVIHVIDAVLVPDNFELQEDEMSLIDEVDELIDEAPDTTADPNAWVIAGVVVIVAVGAFFLFRKKE